MPSDPTAEVERRAPPHPPRVIPARRKIRVRVRRGVRQPRNWLQLVRFGVVGATGYVVNLVVFALCLHALGVDYRASAVIAWVVSALNNFWLNRHWTFGTKETPAFAQGVRFFIVSALAFGFTYLVLVALVGAGVPKVPAEALAIAVGTPLNFVGQKLWSFKA